MSELVKKFFEADLSLAEDHALDTELESFPEAAEAFAEAALAHYAALGLPEPSWDRRKALPFKGLLWPLAGLFALGLLVSAWPGRSKPAWYEEQRAEFSLFRPKPKVQAWTAPPRRRQARPSAGSAAAIPRAVDSPMVSASRRTQKGSFLGVLVKQREASPAEVWVEDAQGRRLATLFDGTLAAGEKRFEWNGRLENGALAAPGSYDIVVKRPGGEKRKTVRVKAKGE